MKYAPSTWEGREIPRVDASGRNFVGPRPRVPDHKQAIPRIVEVDKPVFHNWEAPGTYVRAVADSELHRTRPPGHIDAGLARRRRRSDVPCPPPARRPGEEAHVRRYPRLS